MNRLFAILAASLLLVATATPVFAQKPPIVPDTVVFERGIEYSNPDNQHLQLDMARPNTDEGRSP